MQNIQHSEKPTGISIFSLYIFLILISILSASIVYANKHEASAKLKLIISETEFIKSAYISFFQTYKQPPGDMNYAYSAWQEKCDSDAQRCNGNNDGTIKWNGQKGGKSYDNETYRAWQHLYLSGLIEKRFNGFVAGGDGDTSFAKNNEMYFSQSGLGKYHMGGLHKFFKKTLPKNYIVLGSINKNIWLPSLTVKDTYNIDLKIDDGIANKGNVFGMTAGYNNPNKDCSENWRSKTHGNDYNKENFNNKEPLCIIAFYLPTSDI